MLHRIVFASLLLAVSLMAAPGRQSTNKIAIPCQRFVLDNGLTVLIHEDSKAPIVAVNVWYHVGSKNEKPGKTGFAHLFEHLMFNGSEHFDDDFFKAMEQVGATSLNGTTSEDRTNYFEDVPRDAFEFALWMESDRMGHLLGAVTQAKLDEQRGVVLNEKRQGENQPYAIAYELITHHTWPAGHPYSWQVIGSTEDINAATLDDVHEWFKAYYGPANAVLTIAGDVDTEEALAQVRRYFGHIPSGPPIARHQAWIAKRTGTHRMQAQDRVPQARLYKVWNIPPYGTPAANHLNLVSDVLSSGKSSRLYKRLVYDDQIATDVRAGVDLGEIAGQFLIAATAKPGIPLARVERALDEELARFLDDGPADAELQRAKVQYEAAFIRGIEQVGGFSGKANILAHNLVFTGNPHYYQTALRETREVSAAQLLATAKAWLSDGQFILEIHPFPEFKTAASHVDRSVLPVPDLKPGARFPAFERATLANGLRVVFAERRAVPTVQFSLLLDAGFAADSFASPGTARLAMDMLDEGTSQRTALEISDQLDAIGAYLGAGCDLDTAVVSLNTLTAYLDPALEIYADVILHPAFPDSDFRRLQKQRLAAIAREKAEPNTMALRVMPQLLFGKDHAYGHPFTGSGTEASVRQLTPADMRQFHDAWFKPNHATLVIVGDTTLAGLTPKLERLFQDWKPGDVPSKNLARVAPPPKPRLHLIDRPGAPQSVVFAGLVAVPKANPDEIAIETMNFILGGTFTSRINMNLREDKHWSYGVRSLLADARGQRPFLCVAPVQGDKTKEALQELDGEFRAIAGDKPPTAGELKKAVTDKTLRLAGAWETAGAVAGSLAQIVRFDLPDDYFQTYAGRIGALTQADLARAARTVVQPDRLTWVVVGDRAKIESSLRELNWGEVRLLDADGNPAGK
ncbi:MAG: insulinase family protein [Verrucomicrobia bacterium]|nr:insulinase family protein [Verrucomicrobiota bacterium]